MTHEDPLRRSRLGRLLTASVTLAVITGPFAPMGRASDADAGLPPCAVPGQITRHPDDDWYSIKAPVFPVGPQLLTDLAVEPLVAERLYVTNGLSVMRSGDAGCTWTESFTLPEFSNDGPSLEDSYILEVEVSAPGVVYLPVQMSGTVERPFIFSSTDAGATWERAEGLPLSTVTGRIIDLDASLADGGSASVLMDLDQWEPVAGTTAKVGQMLFTTSRAGEVWQPRALFQDEIGIGGTVSYTIPTGVNPVEFQKIAVDPLAADNVWLYGDAGVFLSTSTSLSDTGLGPTRVLDVSLDRGLVLAYSSEDPVVEMSVDGGQTFSRYQTGFMMDSADALAVVPASLAVTGSLGRVFYQIAGGGPPALLDVSPKDGRPVSDIQAVVPESLVLPAIYGRTHKTIEVTFTPEGDPIDVKNAHIIPREIAGIGALQPAIRRVVLDAGESKTLPYLFDLPAAASPTDVYFLIDISGSMQNTINGIRDAMQDIVDRLAASGLDVAFGLGAFRAYGDPPAYARIRDIGPADQELASGLNSLRASGGGQESQMAALYQSVTGEGDSQIQPGLNMNFRPGSLRIAILVTDEPISQGSPHPSIETTIGALVSHEVKQVGLAIQPPSFTGYDYDDPGEPASDMQYVAERSGALAPEEGADCDGDGHIDIQPGGPIVCLVDPSRAGEAGLMSDAITNVIRAVTDIQDLTVSIAPTVDSEGATEIIDDSFSVVKEGLDLKQNQSFGFDVPVRCPHVNRDTSYPLTLRVNKPGVTLAQASLTVVCKAPKAPKPVVPLLSIFVPVAAIPPPPPRPPDLVPEPNPQPNPQSNPQAQAGFAAQEQQQPQVAIAEQASEPEAAEERATEELFMTAHEEERVPPFAFVFATAVITSIYGYITVVQPRTRTAFAGRRRRRRAHR